MTIRSFLQECDFVCFVLSTACASVVAAYAFGQEIAGTLNTNTPSAMAASTVNPTYGPTSPIIILPKREMTWQPRQKQTHPPESISELSQTAIMAVGGLRF